MQDGSPKGDPALDRNARDIFLDALEIHEPERRDAYLDEACRQKAPLRSRVEALLKSHRDDKFLESAVERARPRTIDQPAPSEGPGTRIGRYKLLQQIGQGGCGTVFMAEQEEPVRRKVALKVIKLGMDTKSVVARFEAERQALALMDHSNIARVLDAGATESGRPYFVMELVKGIPITRFCSENKYTIRQRLDLFIPVCRAIQHAHQKGIIHRDIKPSNILVTLHDTTAVPKVIDFGIAKAIEGKLTDATLFTAFEQFIGTPAYMSPEQAQLSGLDIDTRSDIYSLGVLLYELLTDKTPFDAKELMMQGLDAIRRTILEVEPRRPSTRLSTLQSKPSKAATETHGTDTLKLATLVRGDLDWIVMKCLEKDRTRRYETANGLAADITRHLNNGTVDARPPSVAYRFQKAYLRNKAAFAVTVLIAIILVAATAFSARQAQNAQKAATAELAARQEATATAIAERAAREEAETIVKFLNDVFRSPDPKVDGRTVTVAAALDRASQKLESELATQPARRAAMQEVLGDTYFALSLFNESVSLLEKALAYKRPLPGMENASTLSLMSNLAVAYFGIGRIEDGLKLLTEVREGRIRVLGPEHPDTLDSTMLLAKRYLTFTSGFHSAEAESLLQGMVDTRLRLHGPDHLKTKQAQMLWVLVMIRERQASELPPDEAQMSEAGRIAAEIVEMVRAEKGPRHPDTLDALFELAYFTPFSQLEKKISILEETLALSRQVYGEDQAFTLLTLVNLGRYQVTANKLEDAVVSYEQAVPLCQKTHGNDHFFTLSTSIKLADIYGLLNRFDAAVKLGEATLTRCRALPVDDGNVLNNSAIRTLVDIYFSIPDGSRYQDAITLSKELTERVFRQKTQNGRDTLAPIHLAALQLWSGDFEGYKTTRKRFLPWAAETLNPTTADHVAKLASLSSLSSAPSRDAALRLARRSVELGSNATSQSSSQMAIGMAAFRNGNLDAAVTALNNTGQSPLAKAASDQAKMESTAGFYLSMVLFQQGKIAEAHQRFTEAEAKMSPKPTNATDPVIGRRDHKLLIMWLAHKEAKARLEASPPTTP